MIGCCTFEFEFVNLKKMKKLMKHNNVILKLSSLYLMNT